MGLRFYTLDVFTETRFGGNPLAVVLEADALQPQQMQRIAGEFNLPETVFVLKSQNPAHSARVRIFTPKSELPFAGHPTVGTAALLAELRVQGVSGEHEAIVVLEQAIGNVRVGVRLKPGQAAFAEFDAPKLPERMSEQSSVETVAGALGLLPSEIGFANHRISAFTAGNGFLFVPITSLAAIGRAAVVPGRFAQALTGLKAIGCFLYTRQAVHNTSAFHARMFAPDFGIGEDPATGSAAVAFAGVIAHFDGLPDGMHKRIIEQGFEMGRPSIIALEAQIAGKKITSVRIGGHAVRVAEGTIEA